MESSLLLNRKRKGYHNPLKYSFSNLAECKALKIQKTLFTDFVGDEIKFTP
ncbi:hypothetical protein Goshw_007182 [Gossypium schwendimanii]|uniref:Uncharacterized protein n=1 Tax=Gossypium schwendimanii TaxID=34291 RepID=A0A7J9MGF1_GOSSC|nr:hypothetical protein [Gossypium schwendimanii]